MQVERRVSALLHTIGPRFRGDRRGNSSAFASSVQSRTTRSTSRRLKTLLAISEIMSEIVCCSGNMEFLTTTPSPCDLASNCGTNFRSVSAQIADREYCKRPPLSSVNIDHPRRPPPPTREIRLGITPARPSGFANLGGSDDQTVRSPALRPGRSAPGAVRNPPAIVTIWPPNEQEPPATPIRRDRLGGDRE
jgi:hypothetical protein